MRVEILCTGNELLDGSVVDSNAAWFCARAFALGAVVARKETVPDDVAVIADALRRIGERADFVLVSGGLGPTTDDVTAEAAAAAAGVPLVLDEPILRLLKERFARRGFAFTPNNERQAMVPRGCEVVQNPFGAAPMLVVQVGRAACHLLPGVPREFHGLCDAELVPRLKTRLAAEPGRVFRAAAVLKTVGLPESHLDAAVRDLPTRHPGLTLGFRTHAPENHLKLLAEGATQAEADLRLARAAAEARAILGDKLFGEGEEELAAVVLRQLGEAGATLALAESCTGGLLASLLTAIPGASERFVASAVVYRDEAKTSLLGLAPELVREAGAVSEKVTRAMAEAARERTGATWGLAITGWAGPGGGTPEDPVGTVFVALADASRTIAERHRFGGDRERTRAFAASHALDLVRRTLEGRTP